MQLSITDLIFPTLLIVFLTMQLVITDLTFPILLAGFFFSESCGKPEIKSTTS
jgi:hypothetical protein